MIIIQQDLNEISKHAAFAIIEASKNILKSKEYVTIALPGGRSVKGIYNELSKIEDPAWKKIHIFLVDERVVQVSDPESNFKLIWESFANVLVTKKLLPLENLHPLRIDDTKDYGANNYTQALKKHGGKFDIVLVSSGEDGHIAALYPDHKALKIRGKSFIFLDDSPKPPSNRITSSIELVSEAKLLILLFIGESKREAYQKFNNEHVPIIDCPAKIARKMKNSTVYTDIV